MRSHTRRKWRQIGQVFGISYFLVVLFYFSAYAVLHVKFQQEGGPALVEYWFGAEELPSQRFWRSFFKVANRVDRILRPSVWNAGRGS